MVDGFEFFQDDVFGEQFRKHNRLRLARPDKAHTMGHPGGQIVSIILVISGIAVGPVGFQFDDLPRWKAFADGGALEHGGFVEFAGDAPGRGEIDEDGWPCRVRFARRSGVNFCQSSASRGGGDGAAEREFFADEIQCRCRARARA